jgi:hypothetical protein
MAKFNKGDRVRNLESDYNYAPLNAQGVVIDLLDDLALIEWDEITHFADVNGNGSKKWYQGFNHLELIAADGSKFLNRLAEAMSKETQPALIGGKTREEWLYRFAGQAMQAVDFLEYEKGVKENSIDFYALDCVKIADALLRELETRLSNQQTDKS